MPRLRGAERDIIIGAELSADFIIGIGAEYVMACIIIGGGP